MKLLQIANLNWAVLAVLDRKGKCQVLEFLDHLDPSLKTVKHAMLEILGRKVPQDGPERLMKTEMAAPLSQGLFEFRKQPRKGPKLRVIWFYGSELGGQKRCVVCARAFLKDTKRTPYIEMLKSRSVKDQYFRCASEGKLEIVDLGGRRVIS